MPNSYQFQDLTAKHPVRDQPNQGVFVSLKPPVVDPVKKTVIWGLEKDVATALADRRKLFVNANPGKTFVRETVFQLYLVRLDANGKPEPVGYVEYGYTFTSTLNAMDSYQRAPKWHAGFDKNVWGK